MQIQGEQQKNKELEYYNIWQLHVLLAEEHAIAKYLLRISGGKSPSEEE